MQNPRGWLFITDTAVSREGGWVGFVYIKAFTNACKSTIET